MKKNITHIILTSISILLSAFLPTLLASYLEAYETLVFIIVIMILIFVLSLAYIILDKLLIKDNSSQIVIDNYYNKISQFSHVNKLRIYVITTTNVLSFVQREKFTIDQCEILVRYTNNEKYCSQSYKTEIESKVTMWKTLVDSGRIKHLTIIGYNNLPDNFFLIFDDKILATDLNNFSSSDISGQEVNLHPCWYNSEISTHKRIINRFINHFDNYLQYYKDPNHGKVFCDNYVKRQ